MLRFGYAKYGPVAHAAGALALNTLAAIRYCKFLKVAWQPFTALQGQRCICTLLLSETKIIGHESRISVQAAGLRNFGMIGKDLPYTSAGQRLAIHIIKVGVILNQNGLLHSMISSVLDFTLQ